MTGPALSFSGVGLTLGRTEILRGVSLSVAPGALHAIVGPNGGGKSSLIRALLGQAPHSGAIAIDWPGAPGVAAYVPQALEFDRGLPMTVTDTLAAMTARRPAFLRPARRDRDAILAALARVGMAEKAGRIIGALSGGERQRALMAQALIPEPDLLVLDEPMAALDEAGVAAFERLLGELKARGVTILWIEHDLAAVRRLADRVTGLNREVLFDGPPMDELTPDRLLNLFSHNVRSDDRPAADAEEAFAEAAPLDPPPCEARGRGTAKRWRGPGVERSTDRRDSSGDAAPSTMLRMVPLPRFAEEEPTP